MKKGISAREKVLLLVLVLMMGVAAYYYAFYLPSQEKISFYEEESVLIDDQIIVAEAKALKLQMMKKELAEITSGEATDLKPLPQYDNSRNVMNSLSSILSDAMQYNISFGGAIEKDGIVRKNIALNYTTRSYEVAKIILSNIYNGEYRCLLKDISIAQASGIWSVNVQITYFEYK